MQVAKGTECTIIRGSLWFKLPLLCLLSCCGIKENLVCLNKNGLILLVLYFIFFKVIPLKMTSRLYYKFSKEYFYKCPGTANSCS